MGFTQAIKTVLREKYATFRGRASRSEYWWYVLFNILLFVAFGIVFGIIAAVQGEENMKDGYLGTLLFVFAGVYVLATIVPNITVQVRRFHDRNLSGWWYLGVILLSSVPVLGVILGFGTLVVNCLKGTDGPNKFGPDPLRPDVTADIFA